ncbi:MAG TPA: flagellar hook basal-body protein [Phycisphaerae bacterium]|nr:flagellar hook basal-body protein [Phycisphaerae bacterium]HUT59985.1 flagellar hook basal-body protein [Phycisphaerae bacterium]
MPEASEIASCLEALTERYRAITQNLANANTTAFKRVSSDFHRQLQAEVAGSSAGAEIEAITRIDHTQGNLIQTGRSLDLAIKGKGFFVLESPRGMFHTRNGTFVTDAEGQLVDTSGRLVAGQNGPIVIPSSASLGDVKVTPGGEILVGGQSIGTLKIVDFENRSLLAPAGGSSFRAAETANQTQAEDFEIHQGYLEASNVNIMEELVGLIMVSRLYEANFRSLKAQDDRMGHLLQVALA